jgi:uncharacterized SAM-binding protein YcdF (DUF218 family)
MRFPFFRREVSACCVVVALLLAAVLTLLLGGAALYLARGPLLTAFARWWVVDEPAVKSDAIVVLSGDSVDATRVRRAVELYKQGWAPCILLSGLLLRSYFSEGVFMMQDAQDFGAPASALHVVPSRAGSTLEEEEVILHYAAEHGFHRLLIVTSDYHTRRTHVIYSAATKNRNVEARIVAAPDFLMGEPRWWENHAALKAMLYEFMKFPVTWREVHQHRD